MTNYMWAHANEYCPCCRSICGIDHKHDLDEIKEMIAPTPSARRRWPPEAFVESPVRAKQEALL